MNAIEIQAQAKRMIEVHGDKAAVAAADHLRKLETAGNSEEVRDWRRVSKVLQQLRGPHAS